MKKVLALLMVVVMLISMMPVSALAVDSLAGTGTESDPYLISNLDELKWFRDSVNSGKTYSKEFIKLTADINMSGENWTPIGLSKDIPFKGYFDGDGHTISNLYINNEINCAGLFGYATGTTIKNINFENVDIHAYSQVGTVAGNVYTGSVSNCHVSGKISLIADYAYAGGIASQGYVTVTDCSVIADGTGVITVIESTMAGGITGWRGEGNNNIINCTVKNLDITAWASIGAITGLVHYNNIIDGCTVDNVTLNKTRQNGQASIGLAAGNWSNKSNDDYTITITNNSFDNITVNGTAINSFKQLYGSNYSYYDKVIKLVEENNTIGTVTNNLKVIAATAADLKNAVAYSDAGETITLLEDITIAETINVTKTLNLDLNGKVITSTVSSAPVFNITGDEATFSIKTSAEGGAIKSAANSTGLAEITGEKAKVSITSGTYTNNPIAFVADGYTAKYADGVYDVVEKTEAPTTNVDTTVSAGSSSGSSKVEADESLTEEEKAVVEKAADDIATNIGTVTSSNTTTQNDLALAADAVNNSTTDSDIIAAVENLTDSSVSNDVAEAIKEVLPEAVAESVTKENPATVVVQPYMDITVTDVKVDTTGENTTVSQITVEIEPMYNLVATTKDVAERGEINTDEGENQNAVVLDTKPMEVNVPVTISIPLPAGFAENGSTIYIEHVKKDGTTFVYTATVNNNVATFVNPNGFSTFTIVIEDPAVAKIGDVGYKTLKEAVADVKNAQTIVLLKDNDETAIVSRTVSFILNTNSFEFTGDIVAGKDTTLAKNGSVYSFTYIAPADAAKPSINHNPSTPTQKPAIDSYTDVDTNAWYAEAVEYMLDKGLMNGVSSDKFDPNGTTTRAMVVTMLWRLAGEPSAKAADFTDVEDDLWYSEAIAWAASEGIVNGVGNDMFAPNAEITREQLFTMLYNYAKYIDFDVSSGLNTNILSYEDAFTISHWAIPALQWACGDGLVNGVDGKLLPADTATRAQLAKLLMGFMENL